ncbi:hypothetical protein DIPPA_29057 [Diplonema papillatum]|nr:hypothetical protein DIPPA_29057 [Diplonema papillatum]
MDVATPQNVRRLLHESFSELGLLKEQMRQLNAAMGIREEPAEADEGVFATTIPAAAPPVPVIARAAAADRQPGQQPAAADCSASRSSTSRESARAPPPSHFPPTVPLHALVAQEKLLLAEASTLAAELAAHQQRARQAKQELDEPSSVGSSCVAAIDASAFGFGAPLNHI